MTVIDTLIKNNPEFETCFSSIQTAKNFIITTYKNGGKVLSCGNGGSFADAEHLTGELMKGFLKKRPLKEELKKKFKITDKEDGLLLADSLQMPLRAISLGAMSSLSTAVSNDIDPRLAYAQQVLGLADSGDVFIGISTSGNAENVHYAAVTAKSLGATLIGLTGKNGGRMNDLYDVVIKVPETITYKIQEAHLKIYHAICIEVEHFFFSY